MRQVRQAKRYTGVLALALAAALAASCGSEGGGGSAAAGGGEGSAAAPKPSFDCEAPTIPAGPLKGSVFGKPWEAKSGRISVVTADAGGEVYNLYVNSGSYVSPCSPTFKDGVELGIFLNAAKPGSYDAIDGADISTSPREPEHAGTPKAKVEISGEPKEGEKVKAKVALCYADKDKSWAGGEIEVTFCGPPKPAALEE